MGPEGIDRTISEDPSPGCLFCRQDDARLNRISHRNETCFARLDNFPAAEGHTEVVPKRHVESFFDLTSEELQDAFALILAVRADLSQRLRPEGWTIGVNEGRAAGRSVDHLHIHVIPRRFGDVEDPAGGIRQILPNCDPDAWQAATDRVMNECHRVLS
ncbi:MULTISPECIES: HIT family protein [unclassified Micromonospora]|uniref:HIT family protein n=1 Tax=unclassified Micromonospora TaxID=2617518 RepID=UPI002FF2F69F